MKVIAIGELALQVYSFKDKVGKEYCVVNSKNGRIAFSFRVIESPKKVKKTRRITFYEVDEL